MYPLRSIAVITLPRMYAAGIRRCVRTYVFEYSRVGMDQAASAMQESGLRMQSLMTPRRVYPAKRARLLDAKAKKGVTNTLGIIWLH